MHLRFGSIITHHRTEEGIAAGWRCNACCYCFTRGPKDHPHPQWPSMWNLQSRQSLDNHQARFVCLYPTGISLCIGGETFCVEHQISLIKVDDDKKLGEWVSLCKMEGKPCKTGKEKPIMSLLAVVWWLRLSMAESLGPRMSLRNTSNAGSEQIKILVLVPKKQK